MAQPRASAGSGTRRRVPWRSRNIEAAIREQAQVAVCKVLGLGELGMECSVRAPRCVDARRVMRRAAPVIDRKLRDLQDAGSARTGGLCRRFRRRP